MSPVFCFQFKIAYGSAFDSVSVNVRFFFLKKSPVCFQPTDTVSEQQGFLFIELQTSNALPTLAKLSQHLIVVVCIKTFESE